MQEIIFKKYLYYLQILNMVLKKFHRIFKIFEALMNVSYTFPCNFHNNIWWSLQIFVDNLKIKWKILKFK